MVKRGSKWLIGLTLATVCFTLQPAVARATWITQQEFKCLADNVYFEARGEPFIGQVMVARVTLNRVGFWAPDICAVVYQHKQFSWTLKKKRPKKLNEEAYRTAQWAAYMAQGYWSPANYYHAVSVRPRWAKKLEFLEQINNHKFYK